MTVKEHLLLMPHRLCETRAGNLAHTIGRIVFRPGRPMLVEHLGGLYLEHDLLTGGVMTPGYGDEYNIIHMFEADRACCMADSCRSRRPARWRRGRV
jgi:hypothetical protein